MCVCVGEEDIVMLSGECKDDVCVCVCVCVCACVCGVGMAHHAKRHCMVWIVGCGVWRDECKVWGVVCVVCRVVSGVWGVSVGCR